MSNGRIAFLIVLIAASPLSAAIEGRSASAVDIAGTPRTNFNSTESIGFLQKVNNTAASTNLIEFSYAVTDPSGKQVFTHSGNAAPGSVVGESASQIAGIPVSQIYTVPGNYTLTATAVLDGQTVVQKAVFAISSPIITLLFPPNGARDLVATPLLFSWSGSGASRYRILVDDDPSFYNVLFEGFTVGPETTFTYPDNPPDPRQRLASGQNYYWKVEGLDVAGIKVAEAGSPFSFSVKQQSTQSRDIALTSLEIIPDAPVDAIGAIPFRVTIVNQGAQSEANVAVSLYVNGVATNDSPKKIVSLPPGDVQRLTFVGMPSQEARLAMIQAYSEFFDDNMQNNRVSMTVNLEERRRREEKKRAKNYACSQAWELVQRLAGNSGELVRALDGYQCAGMEGEGMSAEELNALLEALENKKAKITRAWLQ